MARVGKTQLVKTVSDRAELPQSLVQRILALAFGAITEELAKGNSVTVTGFGTWRTRVCTPRPGRHPQSGAAIAIPARTRALFKAGTKLRSAVEYTVDPEVFLGAGIAAKTELEGALARLFGARPETFHLEQATDRIRRALGPGPQLEAEDFFAALCQDLALVDLCPEDVGLAGERNPGAPTLDPTGTLEH